jgi:hypothetical protein
MSVSFWFLTLSLHVAATHALVVQTLLVQSPPTEQILPLAHPLHMLPPQSVSVSTPFFTVSLHVGV